MTIKPIIAVSLFLSLVTACAPQAELVRTKNDMNDLREDVKALKARNQELQKRLDQDVHGLQKRLDSLDANVKGGGDTQKAMADYGAKTDQITTDIQLLQGKLEENNFRLAELGQKIDDRAVKFSELTARVDELEARIKQGGTAPSTSATATAAPAKQTPPRMIEPSEAYRQAKSDYDKGNYDLALASFQNYITQYPNSSQTAAAQFWVGESYYALQEYAKAREAFAKVINNYPRSDKVAGAKLKIGLAYMNEKNPAKAREYFHRVMKEHPGTNEAEIAKGRLSKMGK